MYRVEQLHRLVFMDRKETPLTRRRDLAEQSLRHVGYATSALHLLGQLRVLYAETQTLCGVRWRVGKGESGGCAIAGRCSLASGMSYV